MIRVLIATILLGVSILAWADGDLPVSEEKINPFALVTEIPRTAIDTLRFSFQRDAVPVWSGLLVSTALIYQYDADILKWAQGQGRRWNLGNLDRTKTVLQAGPYPLLRLPSDAGSGLYFLGDGWTHFGISAAFFAVGYAGDYARAWNTGLEIFHGMIVSTMFNQALKRSIGHETPNERTEKRGQWKPFPSMKAYNKNTAKYDAMPSGHLMTATVVFTVIRHNYPEYENIVLPIQILWSVALGFQMVNNGVHWASDYPLGIAMGWAVAKMAVRMGQHGKTASQTRPSDSEWTLFPSVGQDGVPLLNAALSF